MAIAARLMEHRVGLSGASGIVTLTIGPVPPWAEWKVDQLAVQLSRGTAIVAVQHGPTVNSPFQIDQTTLGNPNQDSPQNWSLFPGETITVTFSRVMPGTYTYCQMRGRQVPYP